MFVLIVGAGRVGSAVAKSALAAGHEVSVLDEDPLSHERLDAGQSTSWEDADGQFTVGTALEIDALIQAGIERADVFIASTDGDNTNLIIAQIAQKRFGVQKVLARVMDPARAGWYGEQGLHTISPTQHAIEMFESALAGRARLGQSRPSVYAIIVGAGKVGRNLARELIVKGNEVTLIESSRQRYLAIEEEFEHARAVRRRHRAVGARARGHPARRPRDRGHRRRRGQHARLPGRQGEVPRAIASSPASTTRATYEHFKLLGIQPAVSATDLILRLIEHEVPRYGLVHLLALEEERLEIIELEVSAGAPAVGESVSEIALPEGSLIISVLRGGSGFVPKADTVIEAGDEVLLVLDPGLEDAITAFFAPNGSARRSPGAPDRGSSYSWTRSGMV